MDSKKDKICKLFAIVMLSLYLRSAIATNIDCDGKPFHCVNLTHFMICVDLGAGISKTVNDFVIQCPPTTVCRENNRYECEYQMTTTTQSVIRPDDETNDFTMNTQITKFSNDITNTVSPIQETSATRLFNKYDTVYVTTIGSDVPDTQQTYNQNEISGILEIFTDDKASTSNDQSTFLPATTETYADENVVSKSPEINSRSNNDSLKLLIPLKSKKILQHGSILSFTTKSEPILERPLAANTTSDIKNATNMSNSTASKFFVKSMDTLRDTNIEMAKTDASTLMDQEVITTTVLNETNTYKDVTTQATQTESSDMVTQTLPLSFSSSQTTIFTLSPTIKDNPYFENSSPRTENINTPPKLNQVEQRIKEKLQENSLIFLNTKEDSELVTPQENISDISLLIETENSNYSGTLSRIVNNVELISDINVTALSSTLDSTTTPKEHVADTKQTIISTTVPNYSLNENEMLLFKYNNKTEMSPKVKFTSTEVNQITLEYGVPDILPLQLTTNETKITSTVDYKLTSESSTAAPKVNLTKKKIQQIVSPDDNRLEVTTTTATLTNEYQTRTLEFNVLGHIIQNEKFNTTPSYERDMPEATLLGDFTTTHANISDSPASTIFYSTNDDLGTLPLLNIFDPTVKNMDNMTDTKETVKSTTTLNNYVSDKEILQYENTRQTFPEVEATSTIFHSILLSNYLSDTEKKSATDINKTSVLSNTDNLTNVITTTTSEFNVVDQSIEVMVTESYHTYPNIAENHELSRQDYVMQTTSSIITAASNSNDTFFIVDNTTSKLEQNLKEQITQGKNVSTLSPDQQFMSEVSFPSDITTTKANNHNLSFNTDYLASNDDFTTLSSLSTFEQEIIKQVTDRNEIIESTTEPFNDVNESEMFLLEYDNEWAMSLEVPDNSTSLNLTPLDYHVSDTDKSTITLTTLTFDYENLRSKPDTQAIMKKEKYNIQNEKTKSSTTNLNIVKDKKYIKSQSDESAITTPGQYFSKNEGNIVTNKNFREISSTEPELITTVTSKNISELEMIQDRLLKEAESSNNDLNTNMTLVQDQENTTDSLLNVIFTSTENSTISNNSTLGSNLVSVNLAHDHVNLIQITTENAKTLDNAINDNTIFDTLQHKEPNEMVTLPTGVDKLIPQNTTTDEIYYLDEIITVPKKDDTPINKYAVEVSIQNQQAFNSTITFVSINKSTTETSLWEEDYPRNAQVLITDDIIVLSTSKTLTTTLTSQVDDLSSTNNKTTRGMFTKNYLNMLSTQNSNDVVTNTEKNTLKNKDQGIPGYTNNYAFTINMASPRQTSVKKIQSTETKHTVTITNDTEPFNDTNKNLLEKPDTFYFSPNNSSFTLENIKLNKEDISSSQSLATYVTDKPLTKSVDSTYRVKKEETLDNVTHDLVNRQSNVSFHYYYENNSKKGTVTDSERVTTALMSESKHILLSTIKNNNTITNFDMKNNQFNISNEDRISNKRSVSINIEKPSNKRFYIEKYNFTTEDKAKTEFILEVALKSEIKSNSQKVIEGTDNLNLERNKVHKILDERNSIGTTTNNTFHSNISKIPIEDLGSVTTEPYQPLDPVLLDKQPSLQTSIYQTLQIGGPDLKSTHGSIHKPEVVDNTKKDKNISMTPRLTSIIATTNLMKNVLRNSSKVSTKANQSSASISLFICKHRTRGRFADKNNCRRYYICIGKIQPILGECPTNTVFSEIKKQCTKNLAHCIRNNQFRCMQEGRFSDVLRSNIYYICVKYNNSFIRFQFQCQNGFYLNKTSVRCVNDIKFQSQIISVSSDSDSNKGSDQSTVERKAKEDKRVKHNIKFICQHQGKFPDAEDCRRYYVCSKKSKSVFRRRTKKCDSDEVFHREKKKCVDRDSYECN